MYNAYGMPNYNSQINIDRINNQIRELENMRNQIQQFPTTQTPITQNFQLAPTANNNAVKYVSSIDDVRKELVFCDTLFLNQNLSTMWLKNAKGEIKTFALEEIIELDEKDKLIADLKTKIDVLEKEKITNEPKRNNEYVDGNAKNKKSSNV